MNWWRAHHGLPYDSKLAVVAKNCGVSRAVALAVWIACLDYASQHEDRGAIEGIDPEEVAVSLDLDVETVESVLEGFRRRDMISVTPCDASVTQSTERITAWERRQVQRERDDDSTERTRKYRQKRQPKDLHVETPAERHVTPCDAPEQNRTEQIRAEQTNNRSACVSIAAPPSLNFDQWWNLWNGVRGSNHRPQAEHAYFRLVTAANETSCMVCTQSYLSSLENPGKGYNPENFLEEQARDKFSARWPPRVAPLPSPKSRNGVDWSRI